MVPKSLTLYYLEGMDDSLPTDFASLPSIDLEVDPDDVIAIAETELSAVLHRPFHIVHYYFVKEPDSQGHRYQAHFPSCYVGADGTFKWPQWHLDNITFGDLERTVQHGFLVADPHALVLDNRPFGNGMPVSWVGIFDFLTKAGAGIGSVYAIKTASRDLAAKGKKLSDFLRRRYRQWVGKGGREPTSVLAAVLQRRVWRSSDLAKYLEIEVQEAELLLDCLGYSLVAKDLYSREDELPESLAALVIDRYLVTDPADAAVEFDDYLAKRRKQQDKD